MALGLTVNILEGPGALRKVLSTKNGAAEPSVAVHAAPTWLLECGTFRLLTGAVPSSRVELECAPVTVVSWVTLVR